MSRYLLAAIEQGIWSILNLGVNLMLIRLAAPEQYGVFAFWANCGFVLSSVQNALTVCHLQILAPSSPRSQPRLGTEQTMHGVTIVFLVATALAAFGANQAMGGGAGSFEAPAAALFLPAFLLQQYIRALAFTRGRPGVAATQTAAVLVLAVAFLGIAYAQGGMRAQNILLALGAAYALVGILGAASAMRDQLADYSWRRLLDFRRFVARSGWIFLGVSSTELLTRFYAFIVAGWYGPAALAALSATQQLLRPVSLLASSWSMVARVDLARRRDAGDRAGFSAVLLWAGAGGAAVAALWTGFIYLDWSWLSQHVFSGRYAAIGWMTLLWGLAASVSFGQVVVSSGLQALHVFKELALVNTAASFVAAGAIVLIMRAAGYPGAILGTATGQILEFTLMTALLASALKRPTLGVSEPIGP